MSIVREKGIATLFRRPLAEGIRRRDCRLTVEYRLLKAIAMFRPPFGDLSLRLRHFGDYGTTLSPTKERRIARLSAQSAGCRVVFGFCHENEWFEGSE